MMWTGDEELVYRVYEIVVGKQASGSCRGRFIGPHRPFPSQPEKPINRPLRSVECLRTIHTPPNDLAR